jgi:PKD repeat protein
MKRFLSIYLAIAALGGLLVLGISPVGAYYPPLLATITANPGGSSITFDVYNPQLGLWITAHSQFPPGLSVDDFPVQQEGVMAWIEKNTSSGVSYSVGYAVYDPYLQTFKTGGQGPFTQKPEQLTVNYGVVAFVATAADVPGAEPGFRYAAYDPIKGAWQNQIWLPLGGPLPGFSVKNLKVTNRDGVVLLFYEYEFAGWKSSSLNADIYDAVSGKWQSQVAPGYQGVIFSDQDPVVLISYSTANATIYTTWGPSTFPGVVYYDTHGYDHSTQNWYHSATNVKSYFAAQPTQGPQPLWVWFWDLSLGAITEGWTFGDGSPASYVRSCVHTYSNPGNYEVHQYVVGSFGADSTSTTINVTGIIGCSGDVVVLQNMTFTSGNTYTCTATTSITAGTGVTVQSGAIVNFKAPIINLQPGFRVENGAVFSTKP